MAASDEAIILAGGFGTRLRSVVQDVPKPLAPVNGRPFIAYLLDNLAAQGVGRTVLATGYLGQLVESTLGSRWKGMDLSYSQEDSPLGTGGAILKAMAKIHGDTCFVLNGDTYLELDFGRFEVAAAAAHSRLAMALAHVDDLSRYGAVVCDGCEVVGFEEKGRAGAGYINAGTYWLHRDLLARFDDGATFSFETEVLMPAVHNERVTGFVQTAAFIDIGVPEDYLRAQQVLVGRAA